MRTLTMETKHDGQVRRMGVTGVDQGQFQGPPKAL